jgi:hypothetical protein
MGFFSPLFACFFDLQCFIQSDGVSAEYLHLSQLNFFVSMAYIIEIENNYIEKIYKK